MSEESTKEKEDIVKVDCSYCGKEIECPANMLDKVEKHACLVCFKNLDKKSIGKNKAKVHVDIPLNEALENIADEFTDKMSKDIFPKMWVEHKEEMKEMSKKDLGKRMFSEGIYLGFIGAFAYSETRSNDENMEEEK